MKVCSLATLFGAAVGATLWRKFWEGGFLSRFKRSESPKVADASKETGISKLQVDTSDNPNAEPKGQKGLEAVPPDYIKVEVEGVVTDKVGELVMLLVNRESRKYLPIWIGSSEALAIAMALSGKKPPRPMTHDLLGAVIKALNGEVLRVVIYKLEGQTYYANIVLKGGGRIQEIDARPSDSVALALRCGSPIYISPKVANLMEPIEEGESGQIKRA